MSLTLAPTMMCTSVLVELLSVRLMLAGLHSLPALMRSTMQGQAGTSTIHRRRHAGHC